MLSGPMPAPATERIAIEVAFMRVPSGQSGRYDVPSKSLSAPMQPARVGPGKHGASSASPSPLAPGVKCPISIAKLTFACSAAQGITEIRRCASVRIGVLETVGGAGHHEPGLFRGQVLDHCQQVG